MKPINYKKIISDFRITYRTFEQYEARTWDAQGNIIETYKQVGEMIRCYDDNNEQLGDEILDVIAQMIRLCDFYEFPIDNIFERAITFNNSERGVGIEIILKIVEQIGVLSKYIMMKEKYYFHSRVNEPDYAISDDKFSECIVTIISLGLDIATEKEIDLNETNINSRRIDQEWFPKIAEREKVYMVESQKKKEEEK